MTTIVLLLLAAVAALPPSDAARAETPATLHGRDLDGESATFEAYYDETLDMTWLANANLARSESFGVTGIGVHGGMDWPTALAWVEALNAAGYLGFDDWRLPEASPVDGVAHIVQNRNDGGSDLGFSVSAPGTLFAGSPGSEMAHLHFNTLGNPAGRDFTGTLTGCIALPSLCVTNPGPFAFGDMAVPGGGVYWSRATVTNDPAHDGLVFSFDFPVGFQGIVEPAVTNLWAWPVRSGDVLPVPEPGRGASLCAAFVAGVALARSHAGLRAPPGDERHE